MSLTDITLKKAKPGEKQIKLLDGHELFLLIAPSGTKAWRLKYIFQGRKKLISLGLYPTVSLKQARNVPQQPERTLTLVLTLLKNENSKKRPVRIPWKPSH